ncbi:UDP-glucose 4-epimerase GalE [Candidatus Pelagibacter sp.]|nr:UDP-glucose 4-epimerase GalE [Candidatus Pelagibacter sp.]
MNSILVTGGAGYIGSHIVEELVKTKSKIIILDNLSTGYKKLINKKAVFIKGDVKSYISLLKIIKKYKIESIIHLAACLNISEAERNKEKYYKNNVLGTLNVVKCCKNTTIKNIVFSSSCSIYGNTTGAVSERKKANPNGYYAYTKYEGEKIIKKYAKKLKYNFAILRYFNIAGASKTNKIGEINSSYGHLFKNIAIQSLNKKPVINIYGKDYKTKDGTCVRDYMHVSDLSSAHIKALKFINNKSKSITLNCGYGKGYSVLEIVKIFKKMNNKLQINFTKRRIGDVSSVFANTKKFNKILNLKMKYNNIRKILISSIKWERVIGRKI